MSLGETHKQAKKVVGMPVENYLLQLKMLRDIESPLYIKGLKRSGSLEYVLIGANQADE